MLFTERMGAPVPSPLRGGWPEGLGGVVSIVLDMMVPHPLRYILHSSFIGQGALASAYFFASASTSGAISVWSACKRSDTLANFVPSHSSIQAPAWPEWSSQDV